MRTVGEAKPRVPRPAKELKGFSRVELAAGETKHVTLLLDARAFAFYDVAGKRTRGPSRSLLATLLPRYHSPQR